MITCADAERLIFDVFEEVGLVIGGLVATHDIEDDFIWRLVRNMDVIWTKAVRRLENRGEHECNISNKRDFKPHPAIEEFLLKLGRTREIRIR